jgi:hypothetical protein
MRPTTAVARAVAALVCASSIGLSAAAAKDGDQDPTFGTGGVSGTWTLVRAAVVFPNQDIGVVGNLSNDAKVHWTRVSADGSVHDLCETWSIPDLTSFMGLAAVLNDANQLFIAGSATTTGSSQERPLVVNISVGDHCGSLYPWSDDGREFLDSAPFCDTEDCRITDLAGAQTPEDRLFALVESVLDATTSRFFVVAFDPAGHVDTTFGSAGWAEVPYFTLGYLTRRGSRLALDPEGRPLVLATRINTTRSDKDCVFVRFDASGNVDIAQPILDIPDSDDRATALAVAPDGAVFAAINSVASTRTGWLYQRSPGGTWSGSGQQSHAIADILLQGDNKVVTVASHTSVDVMLVNRLTRSAGSLLPDPSFGTGNGEQAYDVDYGGNNAQLPIALLLSAGRPVILGNADTDNAPVGFALRSANSYVFFDGFERGNHTSWSDHTYH